MIRWRNVFMLCIASAWAHGLASAILDTFGAHSVSGFCLGTCILSVLALVPVGAATHAQAESYALERALGAEDEVRRLRRELADRELKEPLP